MPKVVFTLGILFSLIACQPSDTVFHAYLPIRGEKGWNKQDTLVFHLPPRMEPGIYQLEIDLRNTNDYPFRDIWLVVSNNLRDSLHYETDSLQCELADATGKWNHNKTAGSFFQSGFLLNRPLTIQVAQDSACVRVTHLMRENPLPGITDVGIRLSLTRRIHPQKDKQQNGEAPKG